MTQYINKSAVVAEIDRLQETTMDENKNFLSSYYEGVFDGLSMLENFLDTLEVKDVDLNEEFDNYTKNILACDVQFEPFTHLYNCAKHFFKLGLNAQKGE